MDHHRKKRIAFYDGAATAATASGDPLENLDKPSKAHIVMRPYWDQVDTIVRGIEAMRNAKEKYLPRFPGETDDNYKFRLSLSKMTNVYRDVVEGLASKPFEAPVDLDESEGSVAPQIDEFIENVDGAYNNLTVFAAAMFFSGINDAIDWIFVDYPKAPPTGAVVRSVQDEKDAGIRPFWSHVRAANVLEVRSEIVGGNEQIVYMRIMEDDDSGCHVRVMERDAFGARWALYRKINQPSASVNLPTKWEKVDDGVFSIGVIPMVPFVTGRRNGRTWVIHPPMRDAADLQLELYWQESGLKHIKTLSAFPMVTANGVSPEKEPDGTVKNVRIGPMAVLYAPPNGNGQSGSWSLIEPAATTMTFLQSDVEKTIEQLRELGRNPLTAQSAQLTVITSAVAAKKGNSAVQMWAFAAQDALNNALVLTALWFGMSKEEADKIKVKLFTDFDVDAFKGGEALNALTAMRTARDISQRTLWKEMARRNILSPDFDPDTEEQAILDEGPPEDTTGANIDPLTGRTIPPAPNAPPTGKPPAKVPPNAGA